MVVTRRMLMQWAGLAAVPLAGSPLAAGEREYVCQYRARATVLMLSVPLLHRENVGSGYLRVAEREENGKRRLRLEFGAGSLPERAAGLNRLGMFEETIVEAGETLESALYFGFMTASNEKDLGEAKTALQAGAASTFTTIRGQIAGGKLSNRLLKIRDLPAISWANREELRTAIRERLADETNREAQLVTSTLTEAPCSPFLHAMRCAMRCRDAQSHARFLHSGKVHLLRTSRKASEKAGVTEMEGRIFDGGGKELSHFKLWFEENGAAKGPLRFEFRPRSFLRLSFERV